MLSLYFFEFYWDSTEIPNWSIIISYKSINMLMYIMIDVTIGNIIILEILQNTFSLWLKTIMHSFHCPLFTMFLFFIPNRIQKNNNNMNSIVWGLMTENEMKGMSKNIVRHYICIEKETTNATIWLNLVILSIKRHGEVYVTSLHLTKW